MGFRIPVPRTDMLSTPSFPTQVKTGYKGLGFRV